MADPTNIEAGALPKDKAVVVIGAGTMGSGIAEVAASAGHRVYLRDTSDDGARTAASRRSAAAWTSASSAAGSMPRSAMRSSRRLRPVGADAALEDVGLVIEVIVENLDVKVAVLGEIESQLPAGRDHRDQHLVAVGHRDRGRAWSGPSVSSACTSSIRRRCCRWSRWCSGHATAPAVAQTIVETAKAWGKVPVVCRSTPGFIVNRVARPVLRRSAAPAAGAGGDARDAGCRDARMRRLQDGPVRADGPDRPRRQLRRHAVGLRGLLRRSALQAVADPEGSGRRRLARAQERARVLRLSRRGRAATCRTTPKRRHERRASCASKATSGPPSALVDLLRGQGEHRGRARQPAAACCASTAWRSR